MVLTNRPLFFRGHRIPSGTTLTFPQPIVNPRRRVTVLGPPPLTLTMVPPMPIVPTRTAILIRTRLFPLSTNERLEARQGLYLMVPTTMTLVPPLGGGTNPIRAGKAVLFRLMTLEVVTPLMTLPEDSVYLPIKALSWLTALLYLLFLILTQTVGCPHLSVLRVPLTPPIPLDMEERTPVDMKLFVPVSNAFIPIRLFPPIMVRVGVLTRRSRGTTIRPGAVRVATPPLVDSPPLGGRTFLT